DPMAPGPTASGLAEAQPAMPGLARAALAQPTQNGHQQLAPRSRPPPGRAPRQPLLSGPRSSPFHIRWQFCSAPAAPCCPAGQPGAPPKPEAMARVTPVRCQIRAPVTDTAGSPLVTYVLPGYLLWSLCTARADNRSR